VTQQKPTVGRQVHYYAKETRWSRNVSEFGLTPDERKFAESFRGPYAATIVFVNDDGTVNLNVLFPTAMYGVGMDRLAEVAHKALPAESEEAAIEQVESSTMGDWQTRGRAWVWPPRV
jgi:hypothetical protein